MYTNELSKKIILFFLIGISVNCKDEKRKNELPIGTRQNIIIDARGQGITYSQEQKIIQKIIEKSNGTIKKSDITIWK